MGYEQGLSGLAAASNDLDVVGNNIANSDTYGFKGSTAIFADMYASSVATAVNDQVGIGTQLAEVQQDFSQGTIDTTDQALDIAINGSGFFQMSNNGSTTYTRNGVFQLNDDGYIVNAEGDELMGYAANADGVVNTAETVPLTIPTSNIAPQVTSTVNAGLNLDAQDDLMLGTPTVTMAAGNTGSLTSSGATVTNAAAGSNTDTYTVTFQVTGGTTTYSVVDSTTGTTLSSGNAYTAGDAIDLGDGETVTLSGTPADGDSATIAPTATAFSASDSSTYNYSTSFEAYDSLGGSQTVNVYFAKTGSGTWDVYAGPEDGSAQLVGTADFNSSGQLTGVTDISSSGASSTPTTPNTFVLSIPNTDGSGTPQQITLNITGTTQFGSTDGVNSLTQDGYAAGELTSFSVGSTGLLTGDYSNGQTATLGQIVLATFANQNGLVDLGNNEYEETAASGPAQISTPGSTAHGTLEGGALEDSNVDLTNQLVDLITAQRDYQANAQTIKTQQTVDQTLMNL
ncbi:flagellar hook protein FlgE [Burkholderia sp. WAC0059]|uniref:flagellar hook-basal body complex protein n=1 Tax=Burkholderia sp. WAC0059 TaxID=2066022 RepID=UPI000C7F7151|nr:flagellar hook-basal body complex protein [Burkholderia sp. WAC0059]PLZ00660.1 flagellar hook protein FlgE [Burkholderia sp. WAC0059]